ncbi:MAG: hypothetical protein ISN64_00070 [Rickettsia sp.]|nr:hypothetical protein [Rickettsia sp.]
MIIISIFSFVSSIFYTSACASEILMSNSCVSRSFFCITENKILFLEGKIGPEEIVTRNIYNRKRRVEDDLKNSKKIFERKEKKHLKKIRNFKQF